jgi:hypothetical protein
VIERIAFGEAAVLFRSSSSKWKLVRQGSRGWWPQSAAGDTIAALLVALMRAAAGHPNQAADSLLRARICSSFKIRVPLDSIQTSAT